jgi:hypothetical protein
MDMSRRTVILPFGAAAALLVIGMHLPQPASAGMQGMSGSASSMSMASAMSFGSMPSTAGTATDFDEDDIALSLEADRQEALPGDPLQYFINVENKTDNQYAGLILRFEFPADELAVTDPSGGMVQGNSITWPNGSLNTRENKTLTFRMQLNPQIRDGSTVRTSVQLTADGKGDADAIRAESSLRIIPGMPATGFFDGDLTGDAGRFLRPAQSGGSAMGWAALFATITAGMATGVLGMRGLRKRL